MRMHVGNAVTASVESSGIHSWYGRTFNIIYYIFMDILENNLLYLLVFCAKMGA